MVGLAVIYFWGKLLIQIIYLPVTGSTAQAQVIGYKSDHGFGVKMVQNASSFKNFASGRSPFFVFLSSKGDSIKTYSNAPQLFILFNYKLGDKIPVAYPPNEPKKAVIVSWREFPGLVLMIAFGLLLLALAKDYLFKWS